MQTKWPALCWVPAWLVIDAIAASVFCALQIHGAGERYVRPPVTELAHETHHSRSTIYRALRRLTSYGVVSERPGRNGRNEWHCLPLPKEDTWE